MARIYFIIIFVSVFILILGLIQLLLLRQLNRVWWDKRWVRRAAYSLPLIGVVSMILVGVAEYNRIRWLYPIVGPLAVTAVVLELALMFSLPVSGVIHLVERLLGRRAGRRKSQQDDLVPNRGRRLFLKGAAAAVPIAAISSGLGGVDRAYADPSVRPLKFRFADLPPALDGLRILQLSDLHLGHYVTLDNLEAVIEQARAFSPDIVLVTGDVSDDLPLLPDALRLIDGLSPRLGCYAILGNHEYFRGIQQVRSIFSQSPIPLLVNERVTVNVGGTDFLLAGIDDPVRMSEIKGDFFERCIDSALDGARSERFTLLMSHRPDAFPHAAARGVQLTLAGHTHGAQIGFAGRSLLESSFPRSFLWGEYTIGDARLYTTCGAGHWFPFRLGCPAEAPLIELRRM